MSVDPQPDAFVMLYTQHQRKLYRYIATMLPQQADVDDVLQEAARVMWQKFAEYDPDKPFLAWAYGIARFETLNHIRRAGTQKKYFSPAVVEQLAELRVAGDDWLAGHRAPLRNCLEKLSHSDRELVQQRYATEQSVQQLAKLWGRTPNSLYKSLQRIRRQLFDCVSRQLEPEDAR